MAAIFDKSNNNNIYGNQISSLQSSSSSKRTTREVSRLTDFLHFLGKIGRDGLEERLGPFIGEESDVHVREKQLELEELGSIFDPFGHDLEYVGQLGYHVVVRLTLLKVKMFKFNVFRKKLHLINGFIKSS